MKARVSKSPWHLTDQHQREGEALEIARNQRRSSNCLWRVIRNSEVTLFLDQRCVVASRFTLWNRQDVTILLRPHHWTTAMQSHWDGHIPTEVVRLPFNQYRYGSTLTLTVGTKAAWWKETVIIYAGNQSACHFYFFWSASFKEKHFGLQGFHTNKCYYYIGIKSVFCKNKKPWSCYSITC